jgi:hypothetical protein
VAETVFVFPFDRPEVPAATAVQEISAALANIGVETLLFLRSIKRISVGGPAATSRVLGRASALRTRSGRRVALSSGRPHGRGNEDWFVWERPLDELGYPDQRVEIALMARAGTDSLRLTGRETSPLVVFFPTQKETFLGFVIQGPYRTTPARDNVPEDDEWNRALVDETAVLLGDVLVGLRDEGLLSIEVLQALPLDATHFGPQTLFRPLFEQARASLERDAMIPAADGSYRAIRQLKLASEASLLHLLTPDMLGQLYGQDAAITFASDAISEIRTPVLWRYLREDAGLDEVTPAAVVARLTARFLSDRSDDWIVSLYRFLYRHPALWQEPALAGDAAATARSRPVIRLTDGSQVVPFDARGRPAAYLPAANLPGAAAIEFATVRSSIAEHPDARQFLTAIGFGEPDIVAEVVDHVLPRYDDADVGKLDLAQHEADIELVARALDEAPVASREQLMERLRQTNFLVGENAATGEQRLTRPGELYQRTKALETYFDGNPEIWLAADGYGPWLTQLRRMGVREAVRVEARPADELGYVRIAEEFARHERGIAGFDPSARIEGIEHALRNPTASRSEFVWNMLLVPCRHLIAGVVESSHRVAFADSSREHVLSPIGQAARDAAWLPAADGTFRRPADIAADDLPQSYQRDDVVAEALSLTRPVLEQASRQLGLPADFLSRLSRHPDLVASIERELEAREGESG